VSEQPLYVHDLELDALSADFPRLEALGLGHPVGEDEHPDLLEVVVDALDV
jgi:hypothetical protein